MKLCGAFSGVSLQGLLEAISVSGNTAVLHVHLAGVELRLGFVSGDLARIDRSDVDLSLPQLLRDAELRAAEDSLEAAECARAAALAALCDVASWDTGEFELDPLAHPLSDWSGEGLTLPSVISGSVLSYCLRVATSHSVRTQRPAALASAAGAVAVLEEVVPASELVGEAPRASLEASVSAAVSPGRSGSRPVLLHGSFSNRSLGDLLDVVVLSGNTSVLEIQSDEQRFWVGFGHGEPVRIARGTPPLRAEDALRAAGLPLTDDSEGGLAAIRHAAVRALSELSGLETGTFHLEPFCDPRSAWPGPEPLHLDTPVRPERRAPPAESSALRWIERKRASGFTGASRAQGEEGASDDPPTRALSVRPPRLGGLRPAGAQDAPAQATATAVAPSGSAPAVVIALDADLGALDLLKQSLEGSGVHLHRFQLTEDAMSRIKQYLLRGQIPALILRASRRGGRRLGSQSWSRVLRRVQAMCPRMRIIVLADPDLEPASESISWVRYPRHGEAAARIQALRRALIPLLSGPTPSG